MTTIYNHLEKVRVKCVRMIHEAFFIRHNTNCANQAESRHVMSIFFLTLAKKNIRMHCFIVSSDDNSAIVHGLTTTRNKSIRRKLCLLLHIEKTNKFVEGFALASQSHHLCA